MKRNRGTVLHVPVVHGSYAKHLGDKGTESRSHEWAVYLRPLDNVDISYFIRHVEFVLHESFEPNIRRVAEMPYEVHEYGWGEFEIIIRVFFHDSSEKSVEFFHPLRLFAPNGDTTSEPVVHEFYDEIVFQDPSHKMLGLLKNTPHGNDVKIKHSMFAEYYQDFSTAESDSLRKLDAARKRLREETIKRQERYEQLENERAALVREINSLGGRAT